MNSFQAASTKLTAQKKTANSRKTDNPGTAVLGSDRRDLLRVYGCVLLVTSFMVLLIFLICGIYPFGDKVLRYAGGDGAQYFGILGYLQNTFYTSNDLLYSWSAVLGGNMIGMLAFNAASPFNLLTVFFPNNLMAAYHLIFVLKFVCAALSFAVMLEHVFPKPGAKDVVLFSTSYPFMAYMTYYGWNQSWMDGVILLPLVLLGIWMIVKKQQWFLYTVALAVTLLSNYYIGYMVCLASILFFAAASFISYESIGKRALLRATGIYVLASLAAAGLAAVLLIPSFAALPEARSKSIAEIVEDVSYTSKPDEIFSMLYTAPYGGMEYKDNYPVIYTGIVQLVLGVLFFLNRKISVKVRVTVGVLLVVFALSFSISAVNIAWHGFTKNVWFNFRYSFLVSFIIEIMAYYSFANLQSGAGTFGIAAAVLAGITVLALNAPIENIRPETLFWDIVWMAAALGLLHSWTSLRSGASTYKATVCFGLIAVLTLGNLLQNACLTLDNLGKLSAYREAQTIDEQIAQIVDDDEFFRRGSTWSYGSNDPMRLGYAGVENFASAENPEAVEAVRRLGVRSAQWRSYYGHNVPISTDALLGIRYITVPENSFKSTQYNSQGRISGTELIILQNPYALPLIFPGERLYTPENEDMNTFEYLNGIWNSVCSVGGDVFRNVPYESKKEGDELHFEFEAPQDGSVYAFVPRGDVTVDVSPTDKYENTFYVGTLHAGQKGELQIQLDGTYDKVNEIAFYQENMDVLAEKVAAVLTHDLSVEKKTSSDLIVQYEAEKDSFLTSTIPYDEGWHVYIDGDEVETYRNVDTYLSFDVAAGQHEIELRYWPPYLTLGIVVTVLSALSVFAVFFVQRRRRLADRQAGAADSARK